MPGTKTWLRRTRHVPGTGQGSVGHVTCLAPDVALLRMAWNSAPACGVVAVVEGRPRQERDLVLLAQGGDARAYEELVRIHHEIAFRVAYVITRNAADAQDAAQEGIVKAWRALGRFRVGEPLRPWLLQIVANEARNRVRSTGRRDRLALLAASAVSSGEAAPSPEEAALAADRRRTLLAALEQLPAEAREILACRYLLELSEDETASVLGVRLGTVKSRTARALDRLREAYGLRP